MWAKIGGWIVAALGLSMGSLIGRALSALGIGYATYNFAMPAFVSQVQSYFGALPSSIVQVLAAMKADVVVTIIFSAIAVRMASRVFFRRA